MTTVPFLRRQDIWAGLLFMAFGTIGFSGGWLYPVGTTVAMGAGYFPRAIGIGLLICGVMIFARGIMHPGREISPWAVRCLFLLTVAIICFALMIESLGFVIAATSLILLSRLAGDEFSIKEVAILSVALVAGCVLIFIYGLSLSMPVWP